MGALAARISRWRESAFGYGEYAAPWRWHADRRRWIYGASEGAGHKPYGAAEYVVARIESRAPQWGVAGVAGVAGVTVCLDDLERVLDALGWVRRPPSYFGSEDGQCRNGVVVYRQRGVVFHAAIFDHERGDWGGKASCDMPVVRYKHPEDFLGTGVLTTTVELVFYSPRWEGEAGGPPGVAPAPGAQKTDEWLHASAQPAAVDRAG